MKIITTHVPECSIVKNIDFQDAYAFYIPSNAMNIKELYLAIFSITPKWIENRRGYKYKP